MVPKSTLNSMKLFGYLKINSRLIESIRFSVIFLTWGTTSLREYTYVYLNFSIRFFPGREKCSLLFRQTKALPISFFSPPNKLK